MLGKILKGPEQSEVPNLSLGQYFFKRAEEFGDRECQVDAVTDRRESFSGLKLRSTRVALGLQKRGITSGDVVVVCSNMTLDAAVPNVASFFLGAKVANLDPSLSVKQTSHLIGLVSPKVIFVEEASVPLIEESLRSANHKTEIVVFGNSEQYSTFSDLDTPQTEEESFRPVEVDTQDVVIMLFSSGTTGLPKAICHSHHSFMQMSFSFCNTVDKLDSLLSFTTFYWISGLLFLACSFIGGTRRIICGAIEPQKTFRVIETYKVTCIFLAPILTYQLTNFLNHRDYDTSSLYTIVSGGTGISSAQICKLAATFPHSHIVYIYGLSEIGLATMNRPEDSHKITQSKLGSSGKVAPGFALKIVDLDNDEVLGPNRKGEICIKARSVMKGYHNLDSSDVFDEDGFLKSGDIGYYDDDGYLYVVERVKEMFKYLSWHIVPSLVESVLLEHPAVEEAAVFGLPRNEEEGEVPTACVVLKEQCQVTEQEIKDFVAVRVSDREQLRGGVFFVEKLARTPTGKLMRKDIKNNVIMLLNNQ
jgi:4-coumarate--CoA ligase